MSALDLDDVKEYLGGGISDDKNAELQTVIDAAEAAVGNLVGPLEPVTVTERVWPSGDGSLFLARNPALSLASVTPRDSDPLDVDGLDLDAGVVTQLSGCWFSGGAGPFTVVYQAGWDTLPADIRLAALELVRHLWATQRGSGNARPRPQGDLSNTLPGSAYALPIRVEQMLAPHRVPRVG